MREVHYLRSNGNRYKRYHRRHTEKNNDESIEDSLKGRKGVEKCEEKTYFKPFFLFNLVSVAVSTYTAGKT